MEIKKLNIPKSPGCYLFKDKAGKIIYIGKAADLKSRVLSYWRASANHNGAKRAMIKEVAGVEWAETESEIEALLLEANLVKKYQPRYNVLLRDDKRFQYITVSTRDEIPGLFTARTIGASGRYFGPYTSGIAVRETLKAIRKIWPYCTERRVGKKPCFYAQVGRCCGVCGGELALKDYKEKIIKPITLFLEGKKSRIIRAMDAKKKRLEQEIKKFEIRNSKFEIPISPLPRRGGPAGPARGGLEEPSTRREILENELKELKYLVLNMRNVLEHARILSIGEKYAADVVELAKTLGLKRVPQRIEGYDIANIFGREAVGAMVVFSGGEPDKNEYRKFKIRLGQGEADDTRMLREVLERRFKHTEGAPKALESALGAPAWPKPDLIIVDGGKAQLNIAQKILKKQKLDISVLAVSKGAGLRSALAPDKIFFPGEKQALVLPLASPALHIIKRVRDEAHRFAIGYHKLLRKKKFLK